MKLAVSHVRIPETSVATNSQPIFPNCGICGGTPRLADSIMPLKFCIHELIQGSMNGKVNSETSMPSAIFSTHSRMAKMIMAPRFAFAIRHPSPMAAPRPRRPATADWYINGAKTMDSSPTSSTRQKMQHKAVMMVKMKGSRPRHCRRSRPPRLRR